MTQPVLVLSESVKTGLSIALLQAMPSVMVYREQITSPVFPHFFIEQLPQSIEEERKDHFWLHYLMTVRYRLANEPQSIFNLQTQLDAMSMEMLRLKYIPLSTKLIPIKQSRTEKIDGVLHYFCNFDIQVKESVEEILMWQLQVNKKLKLTYELKS